MTHKLRKYGIAGKVGVRLDPQIPEVPQGVGPRAAPVLRPHLRHTYADDTKIFKSRGDPRRLGPAPR